MSKQVGESSHGKRRNVAAQRPENRSKARHDTTEFISVERFTKFHGTFLTKKKVIAGKVADLNFFRTHNFQVPFEAMGWLPIITMNEPFYTRLIKLFYANLEVLINPLRITSLVKGVKITLTQAYLANILGIPNSGTEAADIYKWNLNPFTQVEQIQTVLQDENIFNETKPKANQLPALSRFLHNIIGYNIIPRGGHRDAVTYLDLAVLTHMLSGVPICLPFIMIHTMKEASQHPQMSLPYGMALTKIFREFRVDMATETDVEKININTQIFNRLTLIRMGFKLIDGVYQRTGRAPARDPDMAEEEAKYAAQVAAEAEEEGAHTEIPRVPSPPRHTINDLCQLVVSLRSSIDDRFDRLEASIENRFNQLEARIDRLEQRSPPPRDT